MPVCEMEVGMDIQRLIHEVQVRPAIWDMTHSHYGDKIKRKESWQEIATIFAGDRATQEEKKKIEELLHKKWKNIRDRYSREVQERKRISGSEARKRSPYMYAQQLMFLEDMVKPRKTAGLLDDSQNSEDGSLVATQLTGEKREAEKTDDWQHDISFESLLVGRKRKLNLVEEKLIQALDCNIKRHHKNEKAEEDCDHHFLLSLLPAIKSIPEHLKLTVRIDVMQCINKYVMHTSPGPQEQQNIISTSRDTPAMENILKRPLQPVQ